MTVYHMVWLKFSDTVPEQRVQAHLAKLRSLSSRVPGIEALTCGKNFTERANGCTHGVLVTLRDRQALADYAVHPYHVEVASGLRQDSEVLVLDYDDPVAGI